MATESKELPTTAIARPPDLHATSEPWFEYPITVYPHHTDYAGIVWHGNYINWLEEARVACLKSIGMDYAEFVQLGCDLPVVELNTRYHRPLRMGMEAIVKVRMQEMKGVRMEWENRIESPDGKELYLTAQIILVSIDREKGKVMRKLPPAFMDALRKIRGI
ncbi:thioesterase superfamily protein [[Leptolyngbya] sp. PCC 7376]|uniref:acyl-CoA thioesterase n=1 Tax=[Leptolyngbya] sp. PCC 7376 TaxID=111781 RepID=UPI00029EF3C3|nr:thioesterase family protein [[Leptolyngbya] sp. PCC 7376]AFY38056.1 thioesterase superfamily protein [[Leptolyngbya] sp. PCC 7376]